MRKFPVEFVMSIIFICSCLCPYRLNIDVVLVYVPNIVLSLYMSLIRENKIFYMFKLGTTLYHRNNQPGSHYQLWSSPIGVGSVNLVECLDGPHYRFQGRLPCNAMKRAGCNWLTWPVMFHATLMHVWPYMQYVLCANSYMPLNASRIDNSWPNPPAKRNNLALSMTSQACQHVNTRWSGQGLKKVPYVYPREQLETASSRVWIWFQLVSADPFK